MANLKSSSTQKNKLLRYQAYVDTYMAHQTGDIPFTVVWKKYVYPKHFISKGTLYAALGTPIKKQLKEIDNQLVFSFD